MPGGRESPHLWEIGQTGSGMSQIRPPSGSVVPRMAARRATPRITLKEAEIFEGSGHFCAGSCGAQAQPSSL